MGRHIHFAKILFGIVFFLIPFTQLSAQPAGSIVKSKAYPNPFLENVTIEYQLQQDEWVEIQINNILGQRVKTLVKERQQAGVQHVKWNGLDESGSLVRAGMYYITLRTPSDKAVMKIMKTK